MQSVHLDAPFTLRIGATANSSDVGVFKLTAVHNDSRCPQDVTCVWAGDASLELRLAPSQGEATDLALSVRAPSMKIGVSRTYQLSLIGLAPHPRSDAAIAATDYRATFKLTRERAE